MAGRKLRFIFCVEALILFSASFSMAQTVTGTFTSSPTPTATATVTPTFTNNPWATPTWTPTFGLMATDTPTPTSSFVSTPTLTFTPTGTLTTPTNTPTSVPGITRSSLALLPTAYSNAWDRWDGLNWDLSFTYYIGSIVEKDVAKPTTDFLNPLRLWLLSSDLKYAWLDENGDVPALASGLLLSMLVEGGNPGATGTSGQSFKLAGSSLGGAYTVLSKNIFKDSSVHFGFVYGFNEAFQQLGIGDFAPHRNFSELLPLFTLKLQNIRGETPSKLFYTGFNTRMLGTNWKFEIWKPFPMTENPVLLNTQVDGLFAFNLAYERWDHGYSVLGYFNFRFTIIPQAPDY